jgi:hypothetical protein
MLVASDAVGAAAPIGQESGDRRFVETSGPATANPRQQAALAEARRDVEPEPVAT